MFIKLFIPFFLLYTIVQAEFLRDNTTQIILETKTFLMWQDDSNSTSVALNWSEAIDYCENNISLGGYTDWRLANINELSTILDINKTTPNIDSTFINIDSSGGLYWSSSTNMWSGKQDRAWIIDLNGGTITDKTKIDTAKIKCVRNFN